MPNASDMAWEYTDNGWCVFPLYPHSKQPYRELLPIVDGRPSWGPFQSQTAPEAMLERWSEVGEMNLAMATGQASGIVVLDADGDEAVAWCNKHGLTSPVAVKTGKGYHYYYSHPGGQVANRGKMWGRKDLQLRGDGGYVVMPPSIHENGHQYTWAFAPGADFADLPVWRDHAPLQEVTQENAWQFEDLDLTDAGYEGPSAWDEACSHVARHGRYQDGDGRNNILTQYVGEKIAEGASDPELFELCDQFMRAHFEEHLPVREVNTIIRSLRQRDVSNHKDLYDPNTGTRKTTVETPDTGTPKGLVTVNDLLQLDEPTTEYSLEPLLGDPGITQIIGYFSHGKSLFSATAMYHLAAGADFGPFHVPRPKRVLYVDFDMGRRDLWQRAHQMKRMVGDVGENFVLYAEALEADSVDLRTKEGVQNMTGLLNRVEPDVVVFDNVRTVMGGFDENKAEEWHVINQRTKELRNWGIGVVLVHHTNKPQRDDKGKFLDGTEAGSGNQLTVVDTQARISLIDETNENYLKLQGMCYPDEYIRHAIKVSYGKLRDRDPELHSEQFLAWTRTTDGKGRVLSSTSNRQKAAIMRARGATLGQIARDLKVSVATLEKWLEVTP